MSEVTRPVPDHHTYHDVHFRVGTLRFYIDSLVYYEKLLEEEFDLLQEHEFISTLLDDSLLMQIPLSKQLALVQRVRQYLEDKVDDDEPEFRLRMLNLPHGVVRLIKSVTELYLKHLKGRRDAFVREYKVSKVTLETIDAQIAKRAEANKGGIFEKADPLPLLIDLPEKEAQGKPLMPKLDQTRSVADRSDELAPLPTPIYGIEILDSELHERCLDLLEQLSDGSDSQRLDTIISEATRILEHRIRSLPGVDQSLSGVNLITTVFGGNNPLVELSDDPAEREGAHLLFRGFFQFIRNPFHHKMIPINRERAIQLLGLVDYLLYLIDNAGKLASV